MSAAMWGDRIVRQLYRDREDAGAQLAQALQEYRGRGALVLGIPRGGVPVAAEVARAIDAELDVIVARKLGAPGSPELAIGAVTANDGRFLNEDVIFELSVPTGYVEMVSADERAEARRREERFRGTSQSPRIEDRIVIIVDDGLATGATMRASVRSVLSRRPSRLVVAVPVGSRQACAALAEEVDEVVCLHRPEPFFAVGLYYEQFDPTEDEEVTAILQRFWGVERTAPSSAS
jgi:putative phosphoribosyl transferase